VSLLFSVSDLRGEAQAFRELASELLFGGSAQALSTAEAQLTPISRASGIVRWQVHPDNPVVTQPSVGSYMPGDHGPLTVHAEITYVWDLEPVRPKGDQRPARHVRLDGLASTQIRVLNGEPGNTEAAELAVWRMEIGDSAAPGAIFHVQIMGRDNDIMFPKELDVPRLPGALHSPFACMEFVLGELFQERWPRIAMRDSGPGRRWRGIQAHRHERYLQWLTKTVATTSGSPWVMWKTAQPDEALFLHT
jgi:hypothetical protein